MDMKADSSTPPIVVKSMNTCTNDECISEKSITMSEDEMVCEGCINGSLGQDAHMLCPDGCLHEMCPVCPPKVGDD
jgi:hypothetical protein